MENVGNYRLFSLIRAGQEYEIWAVRPMASQEMFAMKWLKPSKSSKPLLAGLKHEFAVATNLDHENVIKVYEFGTPKEGAFMIMERFDAPNVKQRIHAEGVRAMQFGLVNLMRQAADGLVHMHQRGWIHRDVKPDNFLVNDDGVVKLIDFNLSRKKATGLAKLFAGKSVIQGTRSYISPEQIRGKVLDERADVYSFGCMVHELLAGKPPFTGTNSDELLTKHLKRKPPA